MLYLVLNLLQISYLLYFTNNELSSRYENYKIEYVPLFRELSNTTEPWNYKGDEKRKFFTEEFSAAINKLRVPSTLTL